MPTNELRPEFLRDYAQLTPEQQLAFRAMVAKFVVDLRSGTFRAGLRIKGVQGHPGVYEVTWAPDGRATFEYGDAVVPGERHVVWRRIGSHDILDEPQTSCKRSNAASAMLSQPSPNHGAGTLIRPAVGRRR